MMLVMACEQEATIENDLDFVKLSLAAIVAVDIAVALDRDADRMDLRAKVVAEVSCGDSMIDREILDQ